MNDTPHGSGNTSPPPPAPAPARRRRGIPWWVSWAGAGAGVLAAAGILGGLAARPEPSSPPAARPQAPAAALPGAPSPASRPPAAARWAEERSGGYRPLFAGDDDDGEHEEAWEDEHEEHGRRATPYARPDARLYVGAPGAAPMPLPDARTRPS